MSDDNDTMDDGWIDDGCGGLWSLCGADCSLQIVRPGKSQCNYDGVNCPNKEHADYVWTLERGWIHKDEAKKLEGEQ